jgi:hypothetical protein
LNGLPSLFEVSGYEQIGLGAPRWDGEIAYLLNRAGLELKPATLLDHTVRLLDLPRLMRRLRPYVAARLSSVERRRLAFEQAEGRCSFALGDERIGLDLTHACGLVMGGPEAPRLEGELGRVLDLLFPLPFPLPGLNYI